MMAITKGGNKICGRLCVELTGSLDAPLLVGSGEQEETHADVIVNAKGVPFIPGSAVAGALRAYSTVGRTENEVNKLFGSDKNGTPGTESDRQSRVFFYDTFLNNPLISTRDGVKLKENKTPDYESKYELQVIERGASFRMRIEIIEREDCLNREQGRGIDQVWEEDLSWVKQWIRGFSAGELRIGARNRRGFGKLRINSAKIKKFAMENPDTYMEWLDWNWDQPNAFAGGEIIEIAKCYNEGQSAEHILETDLQIPYTMLVRTYNIVYKENQDLPDYEQLTVGKKGEQAVIPGSSIAGAFRSCLAKIVKSFRDKRTWEEAQVKLGQFFGTWVMAGEEKKLCASKIVFEEIVVDGGHPLPMVRNAIDRFTGGTIEGALYQETPWAGGRIRLRIRWQKEEREEDKIICGILLWAMRDIQAGILPIGGETAVGRGIFRNSREGGSMIMLDGEVVSEAKENECMQAAAKWCQEDEKGGNTGK